MYMLSQYNSILVLSIFHALQPMRPQRTPPSSPVEDIVDDGQFQFSPPTSRRQLFQEASGQPRAPLRPGANVRPTVGLPCISHT